MDEDALKDFLKFSDDELHDISLGICEIKQAKSNTIERMPMANTRLG